MKCIRDSYKKYNRVYNFNFLVISIGLTLGILITLGFDNELIKNIYNFFYETVTNYNTFNNFIYPIIIYFSIFLISLTILGVFMPFLALFIENMSIGMIIGVLIKQKALKGLLFGIIYFSATKLFYIILLIYLSTSIYNFVKKFISSIKNKTDFSIYNLYSKIILKTLISIILISFYNLLGIFMIPKLIKAFLFLL